MADPGSPPRSTNRTRRFAWKLFSFDWNGATPGEHTLVSRATDVDGNVQPTRADLSRKKTFLEDNAQFPRKIVLA